MCHLSASLIFTYSSNAQTHAEVNCVFSCLEDNKNTEKKNSDSGCHNSCIRGLRGLKMYAY